MNIKDIQDIVSWCSDNIKTIDYKFNSNSGTKFSGPGWLVYMYNDENRTTNICIDDEKFRMMFILKFGDISNK